MSRDKQRNARLLKVFSFGIFLGLVLCGAVAYFTPVTDVHRETSLVAVQPNGGVVEVFRIRIPEDRIMAGIADDAVRFPGNLKWPQELADAGVEAELFKIRNRDDAVIGVASRLVGAAVFDFGAGIESVEWVLNLPARGSLYFVMDPGLDAEGNRRGDLRAATREFAGQTGGVIERLVADDPSGGSYIELISASIGAAPEETPGGAE